MTTATCDFRVRTAINRHATGRRRFLHSAVAVLAVTFVLHATQAYSATLVAHWTFDEAGGSTAFASVGSVNLGLSANASFAPASGVSGGALQLDAATNDHATGGLNFPLTGGSFSLQAWVNLTSPGVSGTERFVVAHHFSGTANGYFIALPASGSSLGAPGFFASGGRVNSFSPINDGQWHQVMAVYGAGGNSQLYVDGALVNSGVMPAIVNHLSASFNVGQATGAGASEAFDGLVDEVRIYDGALTAGEVSQIYSATIPEPHSIALMALGMLGLCGYAWRRRRTA